MTDTTTLPIQLPHKVRVLRKHLDEGIQGNCNKCAIALAIIDSIPGIDIYEVLAHSDFVYIYQHTFALPTKTQEIISALDENEDIDHFQNLQPQERTKYLETIGNPAQHFEPFVFEISEALPHLNNSRKWDKKLS